MDTSFAAIRGFPNSLIAIEINQMKRGCLPSVREINLLDES